MGLTEADLIYLHEETNHVTSDHHFACCRVVGGLRAAKFSVTANGNFAFANTAHSDYACTTTIRGDGYAHPS
jgi:hypothetical protein